MRILGIDYGRRKIGLATATSMLAEAYRVVRVESIDEAINKVEKVAKIEQVEKVVVGVSEGKMGKESEDFAEKLGEKLNIPVETFNETLTSQEAIIKSIEAGIKRSKRTKLEDAYAAALMLQNYLDSNP